MTLLLCGHCTLVQLAESFDPSSMFGGSYGYRSGLNPAMVGHLGGIVEHSQSLANLAPGDVVLDIGSNDGTLLAHYGLGVSKIGIDPSAEKFKEYYDNESKVITEFFSKDAFYSQSPKPAKVITSIAMLYDLESPVDFAKDVGECLDRDGVWIFEQSYMPWMVLTGAYDTICHEHIEYYSLTSISAMLELAGLKVLDASLNDANGGSIRVAAVHSDSNRAPTKKFESLRTFEESLDLSSPEFFRPFAKYLRSHPVALKKLLESMVLDGKIVSGLGASTKGSILVQNAKLTAKEISSIGEVNPYKVGRWMANSDIPIRIEDDKLLEKSDAVIVFPWHFQKFFSARMKDFIAAGGLVIWPLPSICVESKQGKEVIAQIQLPKTLVNKVVELESFGLTI